MERLTSQQQNIVQSSREKERIGQKEYEAREKKKSTSNASQAVISDEGKHKKRKVSHKKIVSPASNTANTQLDHPDHTKLSRIVKNRRELSQQLSRLQYEESVLKQKRQFKMDKTQRSHITQEQIKSIHQALNARKSFEQICDKKNQLLEQAIRQKEIQEEEQKLYELEQKRQIHKEESHHHLQELRERQLQRIQFIRQRNKQFQQLKKKKYPHQKLQENWQTVKKKQKDHEKEVINELKQSRSLSLEAISQHEKQYRSEKSREKVQKEKQFKLEKLSRVKIEKQTLSQFQPSRFLKTIFEEEQNKKKTQENNKLQYRTYSLKKTQYANNVRQMNYTNWKSPQLKPIKQQNVKPKAKVNEVKNSPHPRSESKSQFEIMKIGNDYMREIHSSIGHIQGRKSQVVELHPESPQKYEDYLTKMRIQRETEEEKLENPEIREVKEMKSILKKEGSFDQKFYQVKILANKMDGKVNSDPKKMLASINAKIEMINHLVQS